LPCVADQHACDGDVLQVCNDTLTGFDEVEECDADECNADLGMCTSLLCLPDTYSCSLETNTLRLCNADGSAFLEEVPCDDGICDFMDGECDICAPTQLTCTSGTTLSLCDDEGQALDTLSCTEHTSELTPACSDALGGCVQCVAPVDRCVDPTVAQKCDTNGSWQTPQTCVNQTCFEGDCSGECAPSAAPRCKSGGGNEECGTDGEWDEVESAAECPVCIGDGVCVECATGSARCDTPATRSVCVGSMWGAPVPCANQTCVGDICTGECAPDQTECRPDGQYECNEDGEWELAEACAMCVEEAAGARCVACMADDYECRSDDQWGCNDQQTAFEYEQECAAGCSAATGRCANQVCNPLNPVTCVSGDVQRCNSNGSAFTTVDCTPTFPICDPDGLSGQGQCDRCEEGVATCTNSVTSSLCSADGQAATVTNCTGATPVCFDRLCRQCNPGVTPTRCDDATTMRTCQSNGTWGPATPCVNQTCTDADDRCFGSCAPGQERCAPNGAVGKQTCNGSGAWGATQPCDICTGAGFCSTRICTPNDTSCSGTTLRRCNAQGNGYEWTMPCTICDDANNQCDDCNASTCFADNKTRRVCDGTGHWAASDPSHVCANDCFNGNCVACLAGERQCNGAQYAQSCTNNAWPSPGTNCFSSNLTCQTGTGQCGGECRAGHATCEGQQPVLCSSAGFYEPNGSVCSTPNTICRDGACVTNPIDSVGLGGSAAGTRGQSASRFYATRVTTPNYLGHLIEIGVYGAANGGSVRMAVYSDQILDGEHYPNALVASGTDTLTVASGAARFTDPAGYITLNPNTEYWVVAVTSTTPSTVYARAASAGKDVIITGFPAGFTFGSPNFPTTFPGTNTPNSDIDFSVEYSLFLRVQAEP
jgi:hypothetical protein